MLGLLQAEEFLQAAVNAAESGEPKEALPWEVLTQEAQNSIILRAKRADICDGANPKTDIVEILNSNEVPAFDPIKDYLNLSNKFDKEMALTNNLLVNLDELEAIRPSQHASKTPPDLPMRGGVLREEG